MPDFRYRRSLPARRAWLMLGIVVIASAALSAATSSEPGLPASALAPPAPTTARTNSRTAAPADVVASADAARPASPAASSRPRVVVHTMSMDAPIQGGLTAHQEQAISARVLSAHRVKGAAPRSEFWTPAMGRTAVARAKSWLGMPYSWAGGNATGPSLGRCDPSTGGDLDCHVVGFDCSGLVMYAWGTYEALPHLAATQREAGAFHPTLAQLRPGDLVFFAGYLPGGTGHVAIYAGHGMVVEAPESGSVVRRVPLSALLKQDGVYRGAVRPLTGRTPALTAPRSAVSAAGGTVTLHGASLAGVESVHLDGVTVRQFERHSDSTLVFAAPAHDAGTVSVTVSTSWKVTSRPVTLTYARSRPASSGTSANGTAPPEAPMTLAPPDPSTTASPTPSN